MSGGRAEVNENDCRYRSDHTARKGERQALLIGAHSGSQTMRLRDIPRRSERRSAQVTLSKPVQQQESLNGLV